jgi:hypothetical protein
MAMVRSEGNMSLKNTVTPLGIDPGIVQLVAQRLNHWATPGPNIDTIHILIPVTQVTNTVQHLHNNLLTVL